MAQDPLVRREPIPSTHDRRPSKGMKVSQRSLQSVDDLCNETIWWWLSDGVGMLLLRLQAGPYNIPMTLNAHRCQQEVLDAAVIPHFDNHPLATRPVFIDDNAKSQRGRVVIAHLRNYAIETLPWLARIPDLNLVEQHLWDYLGRQVQARDPTVGNLQELEHHSTRNGRESPWSASDN